MTIHYSDRSRFETGMKCARKRFWAYHFNGRGISPVGSGADLLFGSAIHSYLEFAFNPRVNYVGEFMKELAVLLADQETPDGLPAIDEWKSLFYGLTRTFTAFTLPKILDEYEWVGSEVEITTDLAPEMKWMSRLDFVLRRKSDGLYFLGEAKTSSWLNQLLAQKDTNFQLMMELEAKRQRYSLKPEQIGGALLLVFDKGQKRRATKWEKENGKDGHRRIGPFTYWYKKETANGDQSLRLDYQKGYDRVPAWTMTGWWEFAVENWPDEVKGQVQLWPSVSFDRTRMEAVLRQVQAVEQRARRADELMRSFPNNERVIDESWPQNFSNCSNDGGFGKECPFKLCCFSPNIGRDPIGSELFEERKFNHPIEEQK